MFSSLKERLNTAVTQIAESERVQNLRSPFPMARTSTDESPVTEIRKSAESSRSTEHIDQQDVAKISEETSETHLNDEEMENGKNSSEDVSTDHPPIEPIIPKEIQERIKKLEKYESRFNGTF